MRYFSSDSNATYHGLQARFERRLEHGMSLLAAHTFSKAIDDNFTASSTPLNTACWAQDPLNRKAEKSQSSFNVPQRFTLTYVWEPFSASAFSRSRVMAVLACGWQISGTATFQSGLPFSIAVPGDPANLGTFGSNIRPNRVGPSLPGGFHQYPYLWISPLAFSDPAQATSPSWVAAPASCTYYGNLGRLTERGPGVNNWDVGIARRFHTTERQSLSTRSTGRISILPT